jgi:hypothetical protein
MARKKQPAPPAPAPGSAAYRDRIAGHRRVLAADLKPHPLNFRRHPEGQIQALEGSFQSVGVARSVLAYYGDADRAEAEAFARRLVEQGEGAEDALKQALHRAPLTLIDGHLRVEQLGARGLPVEVEVLDVDDAEAKLLLATLDPLAGLAESDPGMLDALLADLGPQQEALQRMLDELGESARRGLEAMGGEAEEPAPTPAGVQVSSFLVLVACASEDDQRAVIDLLGAQPGLVVKALASEAEIPRPGR